MLIFIDTEFTDLRTPVLISIALVTEDGREFYAERSDFSRRACSDFVQAKVLPLLGPHEARKPLEDIKLELRQWLLTLEGQLAIGHDDWRDWKLFCKLLDDEIPRHIVSLPIEDKLDADRFHEYFEQPGTLRHHALHDARAIRGAFIETA